MTLSPDRQRTAEQVWYRRTGAWQAPFTVRLNDVMVHGFWDADDHDAVRAYLVERFG